LIQLPVKSLRLGDVGDFHHSRAEIPARDLGVTKSTRTTARCRPVRMIIFERWSVRWREYHDEGSTTFGGSGVGGKERVGTSVTCQWKVAWCGRPNGAGFVMRQASECRSRPVAIPDNCPRLKAGRADNHSCDYCKNTTILFAIWSCGNSRWAVSKRIEESFAVLRTKVSYFKKYGISAGAERGIHCHPASCPDLTVVEAESSIVAARQMQFNIVRASIADGCRRMDVNSSSE